LHNSITKRSSNNSKQYRSTLTAIGYMGYENVHCFQKIESGNGKNGMPIYIVVFCKNI
jgi:hypothetical protein